MSYLLKEFAIKLVVGSREGCWYGRRTLNRLVIRLALAAAWGPGARVARWIACCRCERVRTGARRWHTVEQSAL